MKTNNIAINRLHKHNIHLDYIEVRKGNLEILGFFSSNCKSESLTIKAITDSNETYSADYVESEYEDRGIKRYLGIDWKFKESFNLKIPLDSDDFRFKLYVEYSEDGKHIDMFSAISFKQHCNISLENPNILYKGWDISLEDGEFHVVKVPLKDRLKSRFLS